MFYNVNPLFSCVDAMKALIEKFPDGYEGWARDKGDDLTFRHQTWQGRLRQREQYQAIGYESDVLPRVFGREKAEQNVQVFRRPQ